MHYGIMKEQIPLTPQEHEALRELASILVEAFLHQHATTDQKSSALLPGLEQGTS